MGACQSSSKPQPTIKLQRIPAKKFIEIDQNKLEKYEKEKEDQRLKSLQNQSTMQTSPYKFRVNDF